MYLKSRICPLLHEHEVPVGLLPKVMHRLQPRHGRGQLRQGKGRGHEVISELERSREEGFTSQREVLTRVGDNLERVLPVYVEESKKVG